MKLKSVRTRLTLWNVAILATLLTTLGFVQAWAVHVGRAKSIDEELVARAEGTSEYWSIRRMSDRFREQSRARTEQDRARPLWPGPVPLAEGFSSPARTRRDLRPLTGPLQPWETMRGQSPFGSNYRLERLGYFRPRIYDDSGRRWGRPVERPWDPIGLATARGGKRTFSNVHVEDDELRIYSMPLVLNGKIEGVVQAAHSLSGLKILYAGQVRTLWTLIPPALLLAALAGVFLTDRALRPVRKITQAAAMIEAKDLSQRLNVSGSDEISELAATFNGMISRLDSAFRDREAAYQRLEAAFEQQRRFTADASHELRTPLTRIKANTSLALQSRRSVEEYERVLRVADEAADSMNRLVQDLLLLARSDAGQLAMKLEAVEIEPVVLQALEMVAERPDVEVELDLNPDARGVLCDPHHLTRLFVNLLDNAFRHTPSGGRITVRAQRDADGVTASVTDTGEGIPPEHLPHVLERFYRVDGSRSRPGGRGGTGLGLAISQTIARAHGSALEIRSQPGAGTTVQFHLQATTG